MLVSHPGDMGVGLARRVDPTIPIVEREWSEWLPYLDEKGLFTKGSGSTGDFPTEPPGTALPAIYEIARLPGNEEESEVVYVGKTTGSTQGVRTRLTDHFTVNDPLYPRFVNAFRNHDEFYARFIQFDPGDVSRVDRLEAELLRRLPTRYPWNTVRPK